MQNKNHNQFVTIGCRLNIQETSDIKNNIKENQNLIVINTCAVTKKAVAKSQQIIRKYAKNYPDKKIIATGCAAQLHPEKIKTIKNVTKIIDNNNKLNYNLYLNQTNEQQKNINFYPNKNHPVKNHPTKNYPIKNYPIKNYPIKNYTRAFVKIQNGCDHRCTFCIIPYARGNSVSVPTKTIIDKITKLVEQGYQECVLTGVDITAYGNDLNENINLGGLVCKIIKQVQGLKRLRLSSIDCAEIPEQLLECLQEKILMPHLHLSIQSGDDLILKRMKRRHNRKQAIEFCHKARKIRPDIIFGADFIAGFPTENEKHFLNTINIIEKCDITLLHIFPFSPHRNTPAAKMPQNNQTIIKKRADILRKKGHNIKSLFMDKLVNTKQKILIENNNIAYTPQFIPVKYQGKHKIGQIIEANITENNGKYLTAVSC